MPKTAGSAANPFVNGFRLQREVYDFFQQRAERERRTLSDMVRIVLEDHARAAEANQTQQSEEEPAAA